MDKSKSRENHSIEWKSISDDDLMFYSYLLNKIQGDQILSYKSIISDIADFNDDDLVIVMQESLISMMTDDMIRIILDLWDDNIPLSFSPSKRSIYLTWQSYQALLTLTDYTEIQVISNTPLKEIMQRINIIMFERSMMNRFTLVLILMISIKIAIDPDKLLVLH